VLLSGHARHEPGPRFHALLALMLRSAARSAARTDQSGNLLLLHEQNRALWDHMISAAINILPWRPGRVLSPNISRACIAACHSTALMSRDRLAAHPPLYDQLVALNNSPVNRAQSRVAMARRPWSRKPACTLETPCPGSTRSKVTILSCRPRVPLLVELGRSAEA